MTCVLFCWMFAKEIAYVTSKSVVSVLVGWSNKISQEWQLPFPSQCNLDRAPHLLLHYWDNYFRVSTPYCPFNPTAAAEVLIVIKCDGCMCEVWVLLMHSMLVSELKCVISVYEMGMKAADFSISTGLIKSRSLKRTKLKKHICKAPHNESWSRDQMYFYNVFSSVGLLSFSDWSLHQSSFRTSSQSTFPFLLSILSAVERQRHGHMSRHFRKRENGQSVSTSSWQICTLHPNPVEIFLCKICVL